jgi:hypothetical protein
MPGSAVLTLAGVALMYFVMLPLMLRVLIMLGASLHLNQVTPEVDARARVVLEQPQTVIALRASPPASPEPGSVWMLWPDMKLYVAPLDGSAAIESRAPSNLPLIAQTFRLSEYISFVLLLFVGIVIAFQMPLVVVLLGWVGLVSVDWLRKQRKYALFVCAVLAVVITPPDVVSMLIMLLPLYGLYELGILLLVMAPAAAVADGRVFSFARLRQSRRSDKPPAGPAQTHRSAQMDATVPRSRLIEQSGDRASDADGGDS